MASSEGRRYAGFGNDGCKMMEWHQEARRLRSEGWKLVDIGDRFGVSRERVRQVSVGIVCPINHRQAERERRALLWKDREWRKSNLGKRSAPKRDKHKDYIIAHYKKDMSASEISKQLGMTRNSVISFARYLGLHGK